jgi:phosphatidylglycerol:prolipoprotein diacylglycerol transferase
MKFNPYGIEIFGIPFSYYGMIVMFSALVAAYLVSRLLKERGEDPEIVWDGLIWALIFGIIGARLYHVFTPSKSSLDAGIDTMYYLTHPLSIIWTPGVGPGLRGLGIPGAIIGGVIGVYIFARRRKIDFLMAVDVSSPGVALAQVLGRWANFINQELYGMPTDLPWKIFIKPENRLRGYETIEYFHPLFLYESIWSLGNLLLLLWLPRRFGDRLKSGDLFLVYLIMYPLGRFLLEFLRLDYVPMWGINFNQIAMLLVALASCVALILRHRQKQPAS